MDIIQALRGLGLSSPKAVKQQPLELGCGNGRQVIQPMDNRSGKPPRPPGKVKMRKSSSLDSGEVVNGGGSGSRAASPSPSVKSNRSNRSSISLRLFGSGRQRSTSPSPSLTSQSSATSRPLKLTASRQPQLPTNSEIGYGFADRIGRESHLQRRSIRESSSASSVSSYGHFRRLSRPMLAHQARSLEGSSAAFPVQEFRPELYLDPNQGQAF
jgi:hypothetical protein